jgi:hypothetical protein
MIYSNLFLIFAGIILIVVGIFIDSYSVCLNLMFQILGGLFVGYGTAQAIYSWRCTQ